MVHRLKKPGNPDFRLYGIFGSPLKHTLSPRMQEAGFQALGIPAFYLPLDFSLKAFHELWKSKRDFVSEGFNITVPYKEEVMRHLDKISPEALAIGAVNTVFRKGRLWYGTNTDAFGFLSALKAEIGVHPRGKRWLVLGAGGSARAVVYALASKGAKSITLVNRNVPRAQALAMRFAGQFPRTEFFVRDLKKVHFKDELSRVEGVIQTTSVGLKAGDPSLIPNQAFGRAVSGQKKLFVDLIYNPKETRFLKQARLKGHRTLNGLSMLLYQGCKSFEIWTSRKAPVHVMKKALVNA